MTRRSRLALAAALVVVALVIGGWGLWNTLGGRPFIRVGGSPLLDQPAPPFTLSTLDGSATVSLADYAGRPVLVNFWASWCLPCRQEFPILVAAREAHAAEGLEILGVVHDDGPEAAQRFATAYRATWPLLADPDNAAWRAYSGGLLPITYFIDRQGIVRTVTYGPPASGSLEDDLAKIL